MWNRLIACPSNRLTQSISNKIYKILGSGKRVFSIQKRKIPLNLIKIKMKNKKEIKRKITVRKAVMS